MHGERIEYEELMARLRWKQGEHVTIIGPTGYGKTTIELELLPRRDYVCLLATKPRDAVLTGLVKTGGYRKVTEWPPGPLDRRVILWPKWRGPQDTGDNQEVFWAALQGMFAEGGWCVAADELAYLCRRYGLTDSFKDLWQQGRSLGISLLVCSQRPAWIPLDAYTEANHLFLFKCVEAEALKRIQGLAGIDPATIRRLVRSLRKYEFVYVNKDTEQVFVSKTPAP